MSEDKWSADGTMDPHTGTEDQNIVEGTAEIIDEAPAAEEKPAYESSTPAPASYEYDTPDTNSGNGSEYSHSDAGSATGNGNYHYGSSSHEYYQGENFGSSVSGGNGGNSGSGGRGKGFLAVVLAIIFGVCLGAGFWGVHHYLGDSSESAESTVADAGEKSATEADGEAETEKEEAAEAAPSEAEQEEAAPQTEAESGQPAAGQEEAAAPQENTAGAEQAGTSDNTDTAGVQNEAGLVIADTETPDTELTRVVDKVMPSIVSVYNDFTEEVQTFYGETFTRQGESTGSGIIIGKTDDELLIVTNNHVVDGADHLRVLFIDQETCDAGIKGTDPSNDLAVIAVPLSSIKDTTSSQIKVATLGNSDNLKIGETAIAIGNALGYGQSVTTGIVSAANREFNDGTITGTFIQTDAAINPGNSGGALVNIYGNVIGINSSKIGGDTVEGMGFAIPISRAIPIIERLMSRDTLTKVDEAEQGTIGISGATVTSDVAAAYGMPRGVYVAEILQNGGAANSELREGDIITGINDQTVSSMEELQRLLQYYKAGTEVTLNVQRQDGQGSYSETTVKVTLGTKASLKSAEDNANGAGNSSQGQNGGNGGNAGQGQNGGNGGNAGQGQNGGNGGNAGQGEQNDQGSYNPFNGFGFPFGF